MQRLSGYMWKEMCLHQVCKFLHAGVKRADLHTDEKIYLPGVKIFASSTFASSGCTSIFSD
jgi:hypothetical protein